MKTYKSDNSETKDYPHDQNYNKLLQKFKLAINVNIFFIITCDNIFLKYYSPTKNGKYMETYKKCIVVRLESACLENCLIRMNGLIV